MHLRSMDFDHDGEPAQFCVTISPREMALIYAFVGCVSPKAVTDACGTVEWGNTMFDLGSDLGSIGNRFYENGWPHPNLKPIRLGANEAA